MFKTRDGKGGEPEEWLRADSFSLNPGEEKFLSVAAYNEPIPPHPVGPNWIQTATAPSGTFWNPPQLAGDGGAITIIATSAESPPCEVICKFWAIDGKFHWEQA